MTWDPKTSEEVVDYGIDWTEEVSDDRTITASAWIIPDGITGVERPSVGNTNVVRLSGGTAHASYKVINQVTMSTGEVVREAKTLRILPS